jgi:hypothetical protein
MTILEIIIGAYVACGLLTGFFTAVCLDEEVNYRWQLVLFYVAVTLIGAVVGVPFLLVMAYCEARDRLFQKGYHETR